MSQPMSDDDALRMLAGASFVGDARLVLPSGRVLSADEANAFTGMYAADRQADIEDGTHLAPVDVFVSINALDFDLQQREIARLRAELGPLRAHKCRPWWRFW